MKACVRSFVTSKIADFLLKSVTSFLLFTALVPHGDCFMN